MYAMLNKVTRVYKPTLDGAKYLFILPSKCVDAGICSFFFIFSMDFNSHLDPATNVLSKFIVFDILSLQENLS